MSTIDTQEVDALEAAYRIYMSNVEKANKNLCHKEKYSSWINLTCCDEHKATRFEYRKLLAKATGIISGHRGVYFSAIGHIWDRSCYSVDQIPNPDILSPAWWASIGRPMMRERMNQWGFGLERVSVEEHFRILIHSRVGILSANSSVTGVQ